MNNLLEAIRRVGAARQQFSKYAAENKGAEASAAAAVAESMLCDGLYESVKSASDGDIIATALELRSRNRQGNAKTASDKRELALLLTKLAAVEDADRVLTEHLTAGYEEKLASMRMLGREYGVELLLAIID